MKFRKVLAFSLAAVMAAGTLAGCQNKADKKYPTGGDVTVIIPKSPGGGTDISTRGLLQYMKKYADGINFVPTNKPDGGGVTGMVETSKAKPDGYTLGAVTVELAMFPHQGKTTLTYKEFAPIAAQIAAPAALIVPKDAPYNTVQEFADYCKANPNKVQMGNSGTGAIWDIATTEFEDEFGVKVKHIPYPNGTADIVAALAGGHIDATLADPSGVKSQYEAGTVKILGIMADTRSKLYPDVPTFKELGHNLTIRAWAALVAPKDTPADVLKYLRDVAKKTVEDPEYQQYLMKQGIDPVEIIGDDCYKMMEEDDALYAKALADTSSSK
ncbi:Bug family tripartite tricarboxylate transporter substrate binding protein [Caproicibacter sp.]|uniref:Bug family tripartite tricarboxylate transporter substrate binding protein n=1 Tax=Caproicibacter sp. TaxID=2814884 RepID=UPI003989ADA3